jgi:hypothetical protein
MRATEQSSTRRTASAAKFEARLREQEQLKTSLSPEQLSADHQRKVERFLKTCEELGREAEANGLTEEILAEILAKE